MQRKRVWRNLQNQAQELPNPAHYEEAKGLMRTHEQQAAEAEEELNKRFGKGLTHNEHIAQAIYEPQMKLENEVQQEYKDINKGLKEHNVPMQKNEELVKFENQLRKDSPNVSEPDLQRMLNNFSKMLNLVDEGAHVPAHEFLSQWRSMRDKGYNLLNDAKYEKDAITRDKMFKDGEHAINLAGDLLEALKENIPQDLFSRLMKNNERMSKEIYPVRGNSIWREIAANRKIAGKDLIEKLGGQKPGQAILRQHILNNPAASDLMVGSRLAGKPKEFHEYNEATTPYLMKSSPETQGLLVAHHNALNARNAAQETATSLHPEYKQRNTVEADIAKHNAANENLIKLEKATQNKKMSLEQKIKAEAEAKKARQIVKAIKSKITNILAHGASTATGLKILKKLF